MTEQFERLEIEDALSAALRLLPQVKSATGYDELASMIAVRYAARSEFARAVNVADTINDPFALDKTIGDISVVLSAEGQEDGAFELVESIEDFSHRATSTSQIAVAHAAAGNFDRAVRIAEGMEDSASTLVEIVDHCLAKDEFNRALEIVELIDFPTSSAWARISIANKFIEIGRVEEALDLLSEVRELATEIEPPSDAVATLTELALKYSEAGHPNDAEKVFSQAVGLATSADDIYRDAALTHVASGYAHLRRYDEAVGIAENIESVYQAASTLIDLAIIEYKDEGRQSEAAQLLSDAHDLMVEDVPESQNDEAHHDHNLMRIALLFVQHDQDDRAVRAAQSISVEHERHQALASIATTCARDARLDKALTIAREIEDGTFRARALIGICRIVIATQSTERATEILTEAESLVDALEQPHDKVLVLTGLIITNFEAGQTEQLTLLFADAIAQTRTISSEYRKTLALLSIAEACDRTQYELDEDSLDVLWEITAA